MHKYLNAIGYGGLASEKQLNRLLQYAEKVYTHHELMALDQEGYGNLCLWYHG